MSANLTTSSTREKLAEKNGERKAVYWVSMSNCSCIKYTGDWLNDKKDGYGVMVYRSGNRYEGEWKSNMRDGNGTLWKFKNGKLQKLYSGKWLKNQRNGVGIYYYDENEWYEGNWTDNKRNGEGMMMYKNGDSYNGQWYNDQRNGIGTLKLHNQDSYKGYWMNDMKEGPGRYIYKSTEKMYEGEWVADVAQVGEYKNFDGISENATLTEERFSLPELALVYSTRIVNYAVCHLRNERTRRLYQSGKFFDFNEIETLENIFIEEDCDGDGRVHSAKLNIMIEKSSYKICEELLGNLKQQLEIGQDSTLLFSDFIDILSMLIIVD